MILPGAGPHDLHVGRFPRLAGNMPDISARGQIHCPAPPECPRPRQVNPAITGVIGTIHNLQHEL